MTPSTPISTHLHSPKTTHIYQSLEYPSKVLHIHLGSFSPISGPPQPPRALRTNLRPFTLISGPPHSPIAIHTHTGTPCPFLAPSHSSVAFYTRHRPYISVQNLQLQEEWLWVYINNAHILFIEEESASLVSKCFCVQGNKLEPIMTECPVLNEKVI